MLPALLGQRRAGLCPPQALGLLAMGPLPLGGRGLEPRVWHSRIRMLAPTSRKGPLHVSSHRRPALSTQKPQNRATAQGRPQHLGCGCGFPWDPLRSPLSEAWPMGVTGTADGRAEGSPASRSRSRAAVNAEQRLALVRADSGPGAGTLARHTHPETRPGRKPAARPSGGCCGQRHGPAAAAGPSGSGGGARQSGGS